MKNSYRIEEAADYLGVSRRTIERAIKDGQLKSFKVGDARRIEAEELKRITKSNTTPVSAK